MQKHSKVLTLFLTMAFLLTPHAGIAKKKLEAVEPSGEITGTTVNVLWQQPPDLASRNLYYGPGGEAHQPHGNFTFVKEDLKGSNPKFVVRDDDGVEWKIKLGAEARPETVATRLVWAVGYHADEDYFMPRVQVKEMPLYVHRGKDLVYPDGSMYNARLEREDKPGKNLGIWKWRDNPFIGTREYNALRVLLSVMNAWDVKDINNEVRQIKLPGGERERIYEVSDLGVSFGAPGLEHYHEQSRGNLEYYRRAKFFLKVTPDLVSFESPRRPAIVAWVNPPHYISRLKLRWIGRNIPRSHARWMGELLAQLTPEQLHDAFRAAGYSPQDIEGFTAVLQSRIQELTKL